MPKAVIVAPWFGVESGGAEIALLKIANGLIALGYEVEIFTSRSIVPYGDWLENPEPNERELISGIPVSRFSVDVRGFDRYVRAVAALKDPKNMNYYMRDDFFRYGMTSCDLVAAVSALPEDVLIIGGPFYQALIHNVVSACPGRVIVMPAFHDEVPFYFESVTRLIRSARGLLLLTEAEKQLAIRVHGHAFDRAKFETPVLSLPYINETLVRDNSSSLTAKLLGDYMLYVGRLDEGKNITQLMQWHHAACENMRREGEDVVPLIMVGSGVIPEFKSQFVRFAGRVDEVEKEKLLSAAMGLVNLSLNESFSFVVFEAWQHKIPVLVHKKCEVMRSHVDESLGGYACETPSEYFSALQHFKNKTLNDILGWNGVKYADKVCDWDGFLRRLRGIVEVCS